VNASEGWLTPDRLADEAGTTPDYIARLVQAGAITAGVDGLFSAETLPQVRLALALAEGGIDLDDLMSVVGRGGFQLSWVGRLWAASAPTGRTFEEFSRTLGERAGQLPAIYAAFGLAPPSPETVMHQDDERVVTDFIGLWSLVDGRPEVYLRAARIAGDGVRRISGATQDLFDELGGPPNHQLAMGKSMAEAMEPALRLSPVLADLMVWLQARHYEHETFGRIVGYVEYLLIQAGRSENRHGEQPAIAFVDLTGYTELTAAGGDEQAADAASTLQTLATTSARAHRGQVVKLLGDGVMLRYPSLVDSVTCVRELMASIAAAGLPPAHAGIAAGPIVIRDGDVYGHTVNLAARVAGHAGAGELLVAVGPPDQPPDHSFAFEDAGSAKLKGIAEPVHLLRITLD